MVFHKSLGVNVLIRERKMDISKNIAPPDRSAAAAAKERWDSIAKPLGSLGLLEDAVCGIAAVQGTPDVDISARAAIVMCADNGVVCEGVSQSDSSVTALVANEIAAGHSSVNVIAGSVNARVEAVDIGVAGDTSALDRKIARGTGNIAVGAAMSTGEAEDAISVGIELVRQHKEQGTKIIVTGEMGIGNTTTAAALTSVLLGLPPKAVTGRGAGLDDVRLAHKTEIIERAIAVNKPDRSKPTELLAKLGGLDIAGMTGLFLGGAVYHIPVVIDGVISAAAAAIAAAIAPDCREYMLASHCSSEPAGRLLLDSLGLKAPIQAEMRLGEGTGGLMLLPLLDCAVAVYNGAHTFDGINLERYKPL